MYTLHTLKINLHFVAIFFQDVERVFLVASSYEKEEQICYTSEKIFSGAYHMGISSMHIQGASAGSILHNARENFSHSVVFIDEKNECDHIAKEAYEIYRQELAIRSEAYSARTKQKLQKNALTQLSAIFNLEKRHTLEDLQPLKKYLEKELDTKVYQIAIHRDEGKLVHKQTKKELYSGKEFYKNPEDDELYFDKEYTKKIDMNEYNIEKNYHAHIEMLGIDSTGQAIKRNKLSKFQLSKMQTEVAEILHMERGVLGSKAKRRDTHDFKERGTEQQKQKQTVSSLKAEIERLRKEMAEAKQFSRADYQALAKIKKHTKKATLKDAVEEFFLFKKRIEEEKEALEKKVQHLETDGRAKDLSIEQLLAEKPETIEVEKKVEVPVEKIVPIVKYVEVENPINTELEEELAKAKAKAKKRKEKIERLNEELEEKEAELAEKPTVEYIEKEVPNPLNTELEEKVQKLEEELLQKPKIEYVEKKVPIEKIIEKEVIKEVENPINTELQRKVDRLEEEVKEKEEFLSVAVETQEQLRSHAKSYQEKYAKVKEKLVEKEAELAEKPTVEYIEKEKIKEVINPINTELQQKIEELEKDVYSPKYKNTKQQPAKNRNVVAHLEAQLEAQKQENTTLKQENSMLKTTITEITSYLKCTKDKIMEKIKGLITTNENIENTEEKEVGEDKKEAWKKLLDDSNKRLEKNNPKLQ